MVVVETIDGGNLHIFHRQLLNGRNHLLPFGHRQPLAGTVEKRAYLILTNDGVELVHIKLEDIAAFLVGLVTAHHINVDFQHLPYFLVKGHALQRLLYTGFKVFVTRYSRLHALCTHGSRHDTS